MTVLDITVFDEIEAVLAVPLEDLEVQFKVEAEEPILPVHPVRHVEIAEDDKLVVCAHDRAPEAWDILPCLLRRDVNNRRERLLYCGVLRLLVRLLEMVADLVYLPQVIEHLQVLIGLQGKGLAYLLSGG